MILLLLLTGLLVGIISTFFGLGGGVIIIPMLYHIFPTLPPENVMAISFALIFFNNLINIFQYKKAKLLPQFSLCILLSLFLIAGIFLGREFVKTFNPIEIKKIFAFILLIISIKTFFPNNKSNKKDTTTSFLLKNIERLRLFLSTVGILIGGIVAGLTGLGGGVIVIPVSISILKIPLKQVPAYTNSIIILGVFSGMIQDLLKKSQITTFHDSFFSHFQVGLVNFAVVFIILAGAVLSSRWGIKFSQRVQSSTARRAFAAMLLLTSIKMLLAIY